MAEKYGLAEVMERVAVFGIQEDDREWFESQIVNPFFFDPRLDDWVYNPSTSFDDVVEAQNIALMAWKYAIRGKEDKTLRYYRQLINMTRR